MRDLLVTLIVFGLLPFVFSRPHIGILLWSWISYMNPHRLSWGFAYNFPFAMVIGMTTLASVLFSPKKLKLFWNPIIGWLLLFNLWMFITTIFSLQPDESWQQWDKVIKIHLMNFLTIWLLCDKDKINSLIWVIVFSIGFYGFKGGIFTLTTGGGSHVLGPPRGFISGNTEIGLALVMIFPLMWYLYLNTQHYWARIILMASLFLTPIAILGTQSRGALLAVIAITTFLWLKSRHKLTLFIAILVLAPTLFTFMPQSWHDRMNLMKDPASDSSAMGRIQAWEFAYKLAVARPLGGGYESFNEANYERYAPNLVSEGNRFYDVTSGTGNYHDVHSIYFEILGEHGFIGLAIFITIFILSWKTANKIRKQTKQSTEDKWAYDLASMIQVSLIGYFVGGAFLGLAYFDLPYHLIAILIMTLRTLELKQEEDRTKDITPRYQASPK